MRVRGPPVIQSALIGVTARPTGKRFAYPLTYHRHRKQTSDLRIYEHTS